MKQLINKFIFVFVLLVGLSFITVSEVNAINIVSFATVTAEDGISTGGSGSGGSSTPEPSSLANLSVSLNSDKYLPGAQIIATASASYNSCTNTVNNIKVSGFIDQESYNAVSILDNTVAGQTKATGTKTFVAPSSVGDHTFNGKLEIYKVIPSSIDIKPTDINANYSYTGQSFELRGENYHYEVGSSGFKNDLTGQVYPFSYFQSEDELIGFSLIENGIEKFFFATLIPAVLTDQLLDTKTFSIPFQVVNATSTEKYIEIKVLDVGKSEYIDQINKKTIRGVKEKELIRIYYEPKGFNFPFYCEEPVSSQNPNGYHRIFNLESDISDNVFFNIEPDSTTKYDITCSDDLFVR